MEKGGFQPNDTRVDRHLQQLTRRRDKGGKGEAIEFRLSHPIQPKTPCTSEMAGRPAGP